MPALRDREILARLAQGKSQQDIAAATWVSAKTIEVRLRQLRVMAQAPTTAGLLAVAVEEQWIVRGLDGWTAPHDETPAPLKCGFPGWKGMDCADVVFARGANGHGTEKLACLSHATTMRVWLRSTGGGRIHAVPDALEPVRRAGGGFA